MSGHAMPWNHDLSGQEKEDLADARKDRAENRALRDRTESERKDKQRKLRKEQLASMRARYSVGGGSSKGNSGSNDSSLSDASDLFSRISGR